MESPNASVVRSAIRREIVMGLSEAPASTDDLLSDTNASTSAVYDALSSLRRRGLLSEGDRTWDLTAHGQLVADAIDRWQSTEAFLETDPEYWTHHDATVTPRNSAGDSQRSANTR